MFDFFCIYVNPVLFGSISSIRSESFTLADICRSNTTRCKITHFFNLDYCRLFIFTHTGQYDDWPLG